MDWQEFLKIFLNWGVVGIISYFFIKNSNNVQKQAQENYQMLLNNVLKTNQTNVENIVKAFKENSEIVQNSLKYYDESLNMISKDIFNLKHELFEVNNKIINIILEDKLLNDGLFLQVSMLLIKKYRYLSLLTLIKYLDEENVLETSQLNAFRDFVYADLETNKNKLRQEIVKLNYDKSILKALDKEIDNTFISVSNRIDNEILAGLSITDVMRDHNYKQLKSRIATKLNNLSDLLIDFLEDKVRG